MELKSLDHSRGITFQVGSSNLWPLFMCISSGEAKNF